MCLCCGVSVCVCVFADGLIPLCAGAPRGDPGDPQRRSLRAPSSGVRQEEANSSQAPHAQDGRGVSTSTEANLSGGRGAGGQKVQLVEAFVSAPAGWTTGRSAATPGRRRRGSVSSTSSSGSTRAP